MPFRIRGSSEQATYTGNKVVTGTFTVQGTSLDIASDAGVLRFGAAQDLILARDSANNLALRNGTVACALGVYNTYTSATNNELGYVGWIGNTFYFTTFKGSGGGAARGVGIGTSVTANLDFLMSGTSYWRLNTSTNLAMVTASDIIPLAGATNMIKGFLSVPAAAGVPSGTPTNAVAGNAQLYYDTTNHKLMAYDQPAGAWKGIVLL